MPIKIHHGPPGTFKTAGAVADDVVREVKEGRTIVTNIRGLSLDRIYDVFEAHNLGTVPETCEVVSVDTSKEEGRVKLATFFHWAPKGAVFFIDEAQSIFRKSWRESDIRRLDYPGGVAQAAADGRPKDWEDAWDMHRHYNWDFVLTCPDLDKIREDIKGIADGCYKHKDLGLLGLGFAGYIEGFHAGDTSGSSPSHFYAVQRKKVPKWVFKLYDSTTTGQHRKTASGLSIFANTRVMVLLGVLAIVGAWIAVKPAPRVLGGAGAQGAKPSPAAAPSPAGPVSTVPGSSVRGGPVAGGSFGNGNQGISSDVPFASSKLTIVAFAMVDKQPRYYVQVDGAPNVISHVALVQAGYMVQPMGPCAARFYQDGVTLVATCGGYQGPAPAAGASVPLDTSPARVTGAKGADAPAKPATQDASASA